MAHTPAGETRERVYRFVLERLLQAQPPSVRDVQQALGFKAVQSAREQLEALVREGRLTKRPGQARGYALPGPLSVQRIPLLGRVPAGGLKTAVEEHEGHVYVQARGRPEELFALRVQGESMRGAGILDGDIVIVRRQAQAASGDVVVALVEDEATVKRLRLRSGRVELHPDNPAFTPIVVDPENVRLLGKVIEVRRQLEAALFEGVRT
jgi:repressor LexA